LSFRISAVADKKSGSSSNSSSPKELLSPAGLEPNGAGSGALRSNESKVGESWLVELEPIEPRLVEPDRFAAFAAVGWLGTGGGWGADAAGPWIASSLFRTIALKVPVAAVHSGFGGGSTNTWLTSASALNSNASSGIASSSSNSNDDGGGGASRDGAAAGG
jgi:hypothetical protein